MMEKEIWKGVVGFENRYRVSSYGRVKSLNAKIIRSNGREMTIKGGTLTPFNSADGYPRVDLFGRSYTVHRLVAKAFIPNPENKLEVNHKDGNKENNRVSNLEWATRCENMKHAYDTGLKDNGRGESHASSKLTKKEVLEIREKFTPYKYSANKLAEEYSVARRTIQQIIYKETWTHV